MKTFQDMMDWIKARFEKNTVLTPTVNQASFFPINRTVVEQCKALEAYTNELRRQAIEAAPHDAPIIDIIVKQCFDEIGRIRNVLP